MNPLIKQTGTPLKGTSGFELIDRVSGHVIAEYSNTFALQAIAEVYQAYLGRVTDIRQKNTTQNIMECNVSRKGAPLYEQK
jgi:hypothetical protein